MGTQHDEPLPGAVVAERLTAARVRTTPGALMTSLLQLERAGLIAVHRDGHHRFALTRQGEAAALQLGPGAAVDAVVVMVDLVGFVAFTQEYGDAAAHAAARSLQSTADAELRARSGQLVKSLGDGVLGTLPPGVDPLGPVAAIARGCLRPDGAPWQIRAGAARGRPISHGGDLFGADVNLVARLCDLAGPDELVVATTGPAADAHLDVRGLSDPVPVARMALR